jgi:O-antigen/teichoic acid export membrane protein
MKPHPIGRPEKNYGRVAKLGAVWVIGRGSINQIIHLAASVMLARLLTPYDFGIAAAVGFFLKLANKVGGVGLGSALIRVKELTPQHLSSVFVVSLGLALTMWLGLTLSAPALARYFHNDAVTPALRVAALIYLLLPFGVGQMAVFSREFRFRHIAAIEWTHSLVFFVVSLSLAWGGFGFWSLIYGNLLANAAGTSLRIYFGGVQPRLQFSKAAFMEVIPFGVGLQAKRFLTFCAEYLDTLIIGRTLGITALGLYDKAFSTVDRVTDRLTAGPGVFFRIFAIIRDDPERLRRAYQKSVMGVSLLGIPPFAILIVLGPELIPFMYGDQWRPSVLPFQILCLAGALRVSRAYVSSVTQAQGQIWSEIARLSVYVVLVVVGAWVGAWWGIVGVAIGIAMANLVTSILMQSLVCRLLDFRWREALGPQVPALFISAIVCGVMLAGDFVFSLSRPDADEWERLAVKVAAAVAAGLCLFLRPPLVSVREIRDEVLHDLVPGALRFMPAWAGVVPANGRTGTTRGAKIAASGMATAEEEQVSGV